MERGLAALDEQQREILEAFFINRVQSGADYLAEKLHLERTRVYELRESAIRDFTMARYGVVDV